MISAAVGWEVAEEAGVRVDVFEEAFFKKPGCLVDASELADG